MAPYKSTKPRRLPRVCAALRIRPQVLGHLAMHLVDCRSSEEQSGALPAGRCPCFVCLSLSMRNPSARAICNDAKTRQLCPSRETYCFVDDPRSRSRQKCDCSLTNENKGFCGLGIANNGCSWTSHVIVFRNEHLIAWQCEVKDMVSSKSLFSLWTQGHWL